MSDDLLNRVRRKFRLDKDNGWIFGVCATQVSGSMYLSPTLA